MKGGSPLYILRFCGDCIFYNFLHWQYTDESTAQYSTLMQRVVVVQYGAKHITAKRRATAARGPAAPQFTRGGEALSSRRPAAAAAAAAAAVAAPGAVVEAEHQEPRSRSSGNHSRGCSSRSTKQQLLL